MFKVWKTKKKSSASGARPSNVAYTTEEPDDLRSVQDEGRDSDSWTSAGEGHVSTPANTELDVDAESDVYTPPPRPRLYAAAAPRPVFTREHHLQLAGRLYEMEMERVLNGQQEKLSELAAKYYSHLLEAAPSPVSVASPKTSSADEISSEVSSRSSLNSTVSRTMLPVQESSSVVQMPDSVCQSSEGTDRTHSQPVSEVPVPTKGFVQSILTTSRLAVSNGPSSAELSVISPSYREVHTSFCSISAADLRGCPRLTGAADQNVVEILDQYRLIVGLKAQSVRPSDENFADQIALQHIMLIAEGACITLLQQIIRGMIDVSAPSMSSVTQTVANTFDPPRTWSELKRAFPYLLLPANAIQEVATIFLSLRQQPPEAVLEYNIRFCSAIARFKSAVERAGSNRPPIVALYVSHYESTVKPSLQCLRYTEKPAVSLKEATDKTRHEAAGISGNISALSFTKNTTASAHVRQSRPRSKDNIRSKRDRERRDSRPREPRSGEPRPRCKHPTYRKRNDHTTEDCFIRKREAADTARHRKNSQESPPAPSSICDDGDGADSCELLR